MRHFTCSLFQEISSHAGLNQGEPNEAEPGRACEPAARVPSITPDHLSKLIHKIYFRELRSAHVAQGNRRPEFFAPATFKDAVGQEALALVKMASFGYRNGWQSSEATVLDQELRSMDKTFTKEKAIAWYWEFAQKGPEELRGSLKCQIEACKQMYALGHKPALARLSELANIDAAKTRGHRRGQKAAAKLLRQLPSTTVDKH